MFMDVLKLRILNGKNRSDRNISGSKAIEHSINTGKAELDEHQVKLSKHEGTFKKIAK